MTEIVFIVSQGIVEFCFGNVTQRTNDHFSELNTVITIVEVEASWITVIDLNPAAPCFFVLPVKEFGVEQLICVHA